LERFGKPPGKKGPGERKKSRVGGYEYAKIDRLRTKETKRRQGKEKEAHAI